MMFNTRHNAKVYALRHFSCAFPLGEPCLETEATEASYDYDNYISVYLQILASQISQSLDSHLHMKISCFFFFFFWINKISCFSPTYSVV